MAEGNNLTIPAVAYDTSLFYFIHEMKIESLSMLGINRKTILSKVGA
ncbi:hypothetical protein JYT30_00785 [Desulfotalea psychrophila]|uniref:Uncharacterized protein n=1 Tax=Desulfotalea psychrophila TaxID=84980 RepID=A0ABS3ASQ7_9BACT|nr:hypothetical protein [Desulfocapsa sp.]MBN4068151.1 hypothetical protein [Desulfotalea psychrophila]MBN4071678.1 hypothetical protein [Desulfotalea psychrophila]